MKSILLIALTFVASTTFAAESRSALKVSATVVAIACNSGTVARSCAKFAQTQSAVASDLMVTAAGLGSAVILHGAEAQLIITTITY